MPSLGPAAGCAPSCTASWARRLGGAAIRRLDQLVARRGRGCGGPAARGRGRGAAEAGKRRSEPAVDQRAVRPADDTAVPCMCFRFTNCSFLKFIVSSLCFRIRAYTERSLSIISTCNELIYVNDDLSDVVMVVYIMCHQAYSKCRNAHTMCKQQERRR